jgi:hypothetical protein
VAIFSDARGHGGAGSCNQHRLRLALGSPVPGSGVFPTLEEAVYFSMVSFTTVGYGDVVVDKGWRILSGFVAINGLLAFGIFTAVLIEVIRSLTNRFMPRG